MNVIAAAVRIHCRYQIVVAIAMVEQNYPSVRSEGFLLNVLKRLPDCTAPVPTHTELKTRREKFESQRVTKGLPVEIPLNRGSFLYLIIACCHFLSTPFLYWHGAHSRPPHVRPSSGGKWEVTVVRRSDTCTVRRQWERRACPCLRQLHAPKRQRHLSEDLNLQQQRCEKSNIPTLCFDFGCLLWSGLGIVLHWGYQRLMQTNCYYRYYCVWDGGPG